MKAAQTLQESLGNLAEVTTQGDLRQIVANGMLALARKEISATDLLAMVKALNSQSRRRRLTVERVRSLPSTTAKSLL